MKTILATILFLGLSTMAVYAADRAPAPATADPKLLVETIQANRKALIEVNLGLSAEEAAKFWPVYARYQQEMSAIGERLSAIVTQYIEGFKTLSNEQALQLVQDYLAAEGERLEVQRKFLPEFAQAVPGRTAARFYQIENKVDAVLRYNLAATIPVIEEKGSK
jgi:hypothetical protein